MLFKPRKLNDPKDYFPFIGHTLDKDYVKNATTYSIKPGTKGTKLIDMFYGLDSNNYVDLGGDKKEYESSSHLFNSITTRGFDKLKEIKNDSNSVAVIMPRHRSLMDFIAAYPTHFNNVSEDLMVAAGDNLFVPYFNVFLRNFGGFVFQRPKSEYIILNKLSFDPIKMHLPFYMTQVLPTYFKDQMVDGPIRHDLIAFIENNPVPGKPPITGRTKDGLVMKISSAFQRALAKASHDSDVDIYIVPANISFSKYVDALFLEKDSLASKLRKPIKYLFELNYVFNRYPHFANDTSAAKLDVTITYDEPILLEGKSGKGYESRIRERMVKSETLYPLSLIYRAMEQDSEVNFNELDNRVNCLINQYQEKGIDVSNVTYSNSNPKSIEELAEESVISMNTNPKLIFNTSNSSKCILEIKNRSLISHNPTIQSWYGNTLRDIDYL